MADLSVTAANVVSVSGAIERTEDASATITAGQPVYLNSSTQWAVCDRWQYLGSPESGGSDVTP